MPTYFRSVLSFCALALMFVMCSDPSADLTGHVQNQGNGLVAQDSVDGFPLNGDDNSGGSMDSSAITYLALGDSYTIGAGVAETDRWPVLLAESFRKKDYNFPEPVIIAQSGWTTGALLSAISKGVGGKYDLVSLLIGVNNQYIGQGITTFQRDMKIFLDSCITFTTTGQGLFVLSIPDYGVTPFGQSDAERIGKEIDEYNAWIAKECNARNIPFFDITEISRMAAEDPELIGSDQLHPSGKMYKKWVEMIQPKIEAMIIRVKSN
jgi:lysophospholipase L1-like esterase